MTGGEIENFLYEGMKAIIASDRASASPVVRPALSGKVYYRGTRPLQREQSGTDREDVVVACTEGDDHQIQKGECVVDIYVPDITVASGAHMKNKSRTDQLEAWAKTLPSLLTRRGDIYFTRSAMVLTRPEEAIRQHYVSLRMEFRLLNNDYH